MEVEAICQVLSEHGVKIASSTYYEWCDKLPSRTRARVEIFRFHDVDKPVCVDASPPF